MQELQKGNIGILVLTLQQRLKKAGYAKFTPTGFFGPLTEASVMLLQKVNGLTETGVYGEYESTLLDGLLSSRELIYISAVSFLGKDASPNDQAPDDLGCADSVSSVLFNALGKDCGIGYTVSTSQLYRELFNSNQWMKVQTPLRGDVIISPTGWGDNRIWNGVVIRNGHVGIVGDGEAVMSNSSATGTFEHNFTIRSWKDRYVTQGGFPCFFFRKL